jgi:putative oxidoreductase
MVFPALAGLTDLALLLLRLLMAALFGSSGWSHVSRPVERAESIGMSPVATRVLGVVELVGALSVGLGIYAQVGAALLMAVMVGAIGKKAFVWHTGFWGDDGQGWFYDLLYLVCCLVILTTGGGTMTVL